MKPLKNKDRLEELMRKYVAKEHTSAEAEELFDLLRFVYQPEMLEEFFEDRWAFEDRAEAKVIWEDVLRAREVKSLQSSEMKRKARIQPLWKWSAAASVLLLISILWWNFGTQSDLIAYSTGYGETQEIILEDGTEIILNANSEITWNRRWKENGIRKVDLKGEAYFDVAHVDWENTDSIERMPFQVRTEDMVIDVLGTAFNVTKRKGETTVFLERGVVQLDFLSSLLDFEPQISEEIKKNDMSNQSIPEKTMKMVPGEVVTYSSQTLKLEKTVELSTRDLTEWKDGTLSYHDIDFGEMLEHLEGIYGKQFEVQDSSILDRRVTVGFPYEDWETVRNLMEVSLQIELRTGSEGNVEIKKK